MVDADFPHRTDEADLWLAVIRNAINDAFIASDAWLRNSDRGVDPDVTRGDAHRFLTMAWGPWAESRELACAAAGVDAELLAQTCRKRLKLWKAERKTAEVIRFDAALAKLVEHEADIAADDLDAALVELAALEVEAA